MGKLPLPTLWGTGQNATPMQGTKVRRYNRHSAGSPRWPSPMLKYKYIFSTKKSNTIRKLLWFEITEMLIAV